MAAEAAAQQMLQRAAAQEPARYMAALAEEVAEASTPQRGKPQAELVAQPIPLSSAAAPPLEQLVAVLEEMVFQEVGVVAEEPTNQVWVGLEAQEGYLAAGVVGEEEERQPAETVE